MAHRGSGSKEGLARGRRRRGQAAEMGRSSRSGWCRAPPGLWVARIDARRHCEAGRGVSGIQRSMAVRKFDGGAFSPKLRSGAIPPRRGPRPSVEAPGRVLVLRRGYCAAWPGLRCIGAAWQQRRRGAARGGAAWRRLLGFAAAFGGGEGAGGSAGANYRPGGDLGEACPRWKPPGISA